MIDVVATLLFWALAAFFFYGALNNFLARGTLRETYRRWGYPDGFHYVTAALEFIAAILLAMPSTRLFGAALAACVMVAAITTLLRAGLHKQALAPGFVLVLCGLGALFAHGTASS